MKMQFAQVSLQTKIIWNNETYEKITTQWASCCVKTHNAQLVGSDKKVLIPDNAEVEIVS